MRRLLDFVSLTIFYCESVFPSLFQVSSLELGQLVTCPALQLSIIVKICVILTGEGGNVRTRLEPNLGRNSLYVSVARICVYINSPRELTRDSLDLMELPRHR